MKINKKVTGIGPFKKTFFLTFCLHILIEVIGRLKHGSFFKRVKIILKRCDLSLSRDGHQDCLPL